MPYAVIGVTCGNTSRRGQPPRYGLWEEYVAALAGAGATVLLIPPGPEAAVEALDRVDGLMLPGGADVDPSLYHEAPHPKLEETDLPRDRTEARLVREAVRRRLPVLGICRGPQLINAALGGTLYQDLREQGATKAQHKFPKSWGLDHLGHRREVRRGSRLREIVKKGSVQVNSRPHQAIRDLAPGLVATATSPDGIIEAVETEDGAVVAVQCHPESLTAHAWARRLFADLVRTAAANRG